MPLNKRATPQLIGLFVIGAILMAIAGVMVFGSTGLFTEKEKYVLYFSGSVKGLNVGAPVNFRGVKIGTVTSISVNVQPEQLVFKIPVIIEIEPNRIEAMGEDQNPINVFEKLLQENSLKRLIDKGLRAQLQLQSIVTGQLFVQLDMFPDTPVVLQGGNGDYKELPTIPSGFQELSQTFDKIPLEEVVQKLLSTLDGIEKLVNSPDLANSFVRMNETLGELQQLSKKLNQQLPPVLQRANQTFDRVDQAFVRVDRAAVRVEVGMDELVSDIHVTTEALRTAMNNADALVENMNRVLEPDSPYHARISGTLEELSRAARSVRVLAEEIEQHPEVLLRGKETRGEQ